MLVPVPVCLRDIARAIASVAPNASGPLSRYHVVRPLSCDHFAVLHAIDPPALLASADHYSVPEMRGYDRSIDPAPRRPIRSAPQPPVPRERIVSRNRNRIVMHAV